MTLPSLGWTIGGAATSITQPLPVQNTQASLTSDFLPLYSASGAGLVGINLANLLGVSSQVVSINDPQTLTRKTLDNTNSFTAKDTSFTLQSGASVTKQAQFLLSGITAGQTRVFSLPDYNATLATLAGTETFTNKTLTMPTITSPIITNATLSADSIAGFTVSNTGTIFGIPVTTGVINTANTLNGSSIVGATVGATALATNAVQASQIATNAILLGVAQITTIFTTTSTSYVQVTGLTNTITVPSGARRIEIGVQIRSISNSNSSTGNFISIWDGTVGSGTQLQEFEVDITTSTFNNGIYFIALPPAPSPGSKTYNVGVKTTAGTLSIMAAAVYPALTFVRYN